MNSDLSPTSATALPFLPRATGQARQPTTADPGNERKRTASSDNESPIGHLPREKRTANDGDFSRTPQELDAAHALLALDPSRTTMDFVQSQQLFAPGPKHFVHACTALTQAELARVIQHLGSLAEFGRHFGLKAVRGSFTADGRTRHPEVVQKDTERFDSWLSNKTASEFAAYVNQTREYLQALLAAGSASPRAIDLFAALRRLGEHEQQALLKHWSMRDIGRLFCGDARALSSYVSASGNVLPAHVQPRKEPAGENDPSIQQVAALLRTLLNGPPGVDAPRPS